jgi:HlyD family secretion protein
MDVAINPRISRVFSAVAAAWVLAVSSPTPAGTPGPALLDGSGYVVARRAATVSARVVGRVVELYIEEGQHVSAGQILARLDASNSEAAYRQAQAQLAAAEADLAAASVALADAQPIFTRNTVQLAAGLISPQAFDNAAATFHTAEAQHAMRETAVTVARAGIKVAQTAVNDTVIRAPFAGTITEKAAQVGEIVSPMSAGGGFTRTGIGTIVDTESLEVEVDVSEGFINRVSRGQPASVTLNAYPDWSIPAHVVALIPTADRAKATVKVRVGFDSRDKRILPQMGARVSFYAPSPQLTRADAAAR